MVTKRICSGMALLVVCWNNCLLLPYRSAAVAVIKLLLTVTATLCGVTWDHPETLGGKRHDSANHLRLQMYVAT